jgi:death on curing protein
VTFCLRLEAVIAIQSRFGEGGGLRDRESLEGSLARPMQTGYGTDLYPTVMQKAAALLHGLSTTQPFHNGNKRTAWTCCVTFLRQHDLRVCDEVTEEEIIEFVLRISNGVHDVPEVALQLLEWLD